MGNLRTAPPPPSSFVEYFRLSAPYIHAHRGRTFVIMFGGEAVLDSKFHHLIHDIALMHALGVRLVLVHGSRPQIDQRLDERGIEPVFHEGVRITDPPTMECVQDAVGSTRMKIEGLLSMGLPSSPMEHARLRVASGNFVIARPLGVRDGVDFQHTGDARRIDAEGIRMRLDSGAIVLLSPLGYSPAGERYNLSSHELAAGAAIALGADKLIVLLEGKGIVDTRNRLLPQLMPDEVDTLVQSTSHLDADARQCLSQAARACRAGVRRAHLVERRIDGVLLQELFTREGQGTLVTAERYEAMRPARVEDVGGLLALLRPLEEAGILVRRTRETLEHELDKFSVVERDGLIIGCAALDIFPLEGMGELYCLAVHPRYRETGRGESIVEAMCDRARAAGLSQIFVLTTQTSDWFVERGFEAATIRELPEQRRARYDRKRRSKVLVREL